MPSDNTDAFRGTIFKSDTQLTAIDLEKRSKADPMTVLEELTRQAEAIANELAKRRPVPAKKAEPTPTPSRPRTAATARTATPTAAKFVPAVMKAEQPAQKMLSVRIVDRTTRS